MWSIFHYATHFSPLYHHYYDILSSQLSRIWLWVPVIFSESVRRPETVRSSDSADKGWREMASVSFILYALSCRVESSLVLSCSPSGVATFLSSASAAAVDVTTTIMTWRQGALIVVYNRWMISGEDVRQFGIQKEEESGILYLRKNRNRVEVNLRSNDYGEWEKWHDKEISWRWGVPI